MAAKLASMGRSLLTFRRITWIVPALGHLGKQHHRRHASSSSLTIPRPFGPFVCYPRSSSPIHQCIPLPLRCPCQSCGHKVLKLQYSREYYLKHWSNSHLVFWHHFGPGVVPQDQRRWLHLPPPAAPVLPAIPSIHPLPLAPNQFLAPAPASRRQCALSHCLATRRCSLRTASSSDAGYLAQVHVLCKAHVVLLRQDPDRALPCGPHARCKHDNVRPDDVLLGKVLFGGVYPVSAVFRAAVQVYACSCVGVGVLVDEGLAVRPGAGRGVARTRVAAMRECGTNNDIDFYL
ncbi:hypothetical protein GGX14DRAFT_648956 [Mycena pura]|uniref:Uncharacterized protein n=1 Tax=Mycena pura TaxID=153505 RepID=A0AAD6YMZ0_9AGAR|nr:hypothetical protein GGX14DRAFT_648956 [Mycena pura]